MCDSHPRPRFMVRRTYRSGPDRPADELSGSGEQRLTATGPPRETYWTDFFGAADKDEVFDVAWPVA